LLDVVDSRLRLAHLLTFFLRHQLVHTSPKINIMQMATEDDEISLVSGQETEYVHQDRDKHQQDGDNVSLSPVSVGPMDVQVIFLY